MRTIQNKTRLFNALAFWLCATIAFANSPINVEKKKTITKSFSVSSKDRLSINNQFGDVNVSLWDRNEIRIDITITGYGDNDENAQKYLEAVEIVDIRDNEQITFKTNIDNDRFGNKWNWGNIKRKDGSEEKRGVKVDYQVSMPKQNTLAISNKFGGTIIPEFTAPLKVHSSYGSFKTDRLTGNGKDIDVSFGSAYIKVIDTGKLKISYSSLTVERANDLNLDNDFGTLKIDEVDKIVGDIGYSKCTFGTLKESADLKLRFSGGCKFTSIPQTVKNINIDAQYSEVALPVGDNNNFDFDVTVHYGGFKFPSDKVVLTVNPDKEDDEKNNWSPKFTKTYKGKIGKGGGNLRIKTNFSGVKFY
ncbi:MAG: hypothetical protein U0Y10_01715 [Spirosomataceae bacterium]